MVHCPNATTNDAQKFWYTTRIWYIFMRFITRLRYFMGNYVAPEDRRVWLWAGSDAQSRDASVDTFRTNQIELLFEGLTMCRWNRPELLSSGAYIWLPVPIIIINLSEGIHTNSDIWQDQCPQFLSIKPFNLCLAFHSSQSVALWCGAWYDNYAQAGSVTDRNR